MKGFVEPVNGQKKINFWDYFSTIEHSALFYLVNEEIQSAARKFKMSYILNFPARFSAEFPHSQDKGAGISKTFLTFSVLYPIFIHYTLFCCSSIFIFAILLHISQILVKSARWALAASLLFSKQDSLGFLCHILYFFDKLISNGNNFDTLYMVTLQIKTKLLFYT